VLSIIAASRRRVLQPADGCEVTPYWGRGGEKKPSTTTSETRGRESLKATLMSSGSVVLRHGQDKPEGKCHIREEDLKLSGGVLLVRRESRKHTTMEEKRREES